jgi:hypothetical protein
MTTPNSLLQVNDSGLGSLARCEGPPRAPGCMSGAVDSTGNRTDTEADQTQWPTMDTFFLTLTDCVHTEFTFQES